jgi:hypothetical protein
MSDRKTRGLNGKKQNLLNTQEEADQAKLTLQLEKKLKD